MPTKNEAPKGRKIKTEQGHELVVDAASSEEYFIEFAGSVEDTAMKCSNCKMLTLHDGYAFNVVHDLPTKIGSTEKRVYCCANCGKVSLK